MKPKSFEKILKSPTCWGFFFVLLLPSCNKQEKPPTIQVKSESKGFTYSPPIELINALRNVAGFEDSHRIPGHEKLGHDHSSSESWTTKEAVEKLGKVAQNYKELNPGFEKIVGNCFIPDHSFHTYEVGQGMKHYSMANSPEIGTEVFQAFKDLPETDWVLVFQDRILLIQMAENDRLKVKEKRLSR